MYCCKEPWQQSLHSSVPLGQRGILSVYRWRNEVPGGDGLCLGPELPLSHSLLLFLQCAWLELTQSLLYSPTWILKVNPWSSVNTLFRYWYSLDMLGRIPRILPLKTNAIPSLRGGGGAEIIAMLPFYRRERNTWLPTPSGYPTSPLSSHQVQPFPDSQLNGICTKRYWICPFPIHPSDSKFLYYSMPRQPLLIYV